MENVLAEVRHLVAWVAQTTPDQVAAADDLALDLGLDSLQVVEVVLEVEIT